MFLLGLPGKFICSLKFQEQFSCWIWEQFSPILVCRCTSPFHRKHIFRFQPLVLHTYLPPRRFERNGQQPSRRSQSTMFHSLKSSSSSCMSPGDDSAGHKSPRSQYTLMNMSSQTSPKNKPPWKEL